MKPNGAPKGGPKGDLKEGGPKGDPKGDPKEGGPKGVPRGDHNEGGPNGEPRGVLKGERKVDTIVEAMQSTMEVKTAGLEATKLKTAGPEKRASS